MSASGAMVERVGLAAAGKSMHAAVYRGAGRVVAPRKEGFVVYVVSVSIHVVEDQCDAFVAATLDNARHTRREPGNLRFDVLRQEQDRTRFMFYEAYRSAADFTAHQQTPHYLKWKETVAGWMAEPRVGVKHASVYPPDAEW